MRLPGEERESYSSSKDTLATATARVEKITAELDKINSNPKATTSQIVSTINRLNAATEIQLKEIQNTLNTATVNQDLVTSGFNEVPSYSGIPSGGTIVAAVPATPTTIAAAIIAPPPPPVKTAPIDTVLFDDEGIDIEVIKDLIFEDIGGHELINIARNDIVNGQQVSYQPIKNLSSIQQQYNPNNILSLQSTSDKYFANFSIKLENKIPDPGTGPSGAYVYLDNDTGNLIIEAINLETDEQIQVEITTSGTIYEAEFGEVTS
jgi:hypothetical protein